MIRSRSGRRSCAIARDGLKSECRKVRGGGRVRGESVFLNPANDDFAGIANACARASAPDVAAELSESLNQRFDELGEVVLLCS
jgi:hypothetical protein